MAKHKLIILERAAFEFENACAYYNNQVLGLGYELEDEIITLLELIKDNPVLFSTKFAHIREAVVKRFPFAINFEITEKLIIVSAIFHVKQSPTKKIKRKRK